MHTCHICNYELAAETFKIKEMQFGTREVFDYNMCPHCGCLQIAAIPKDLPSYYPGQYYSMKVKEYSNNPFFAWLRKANLSIQLKKSMVSRILPKPRLPQWISMLNITPYTKMLDVGSGAGQKILQLKKKGFSNLAGIDPFITEDIRYENGIKIEKIDIVDYARKHDVGDFEVITMNHSLEHIPDQHETLKAAFNLLAKHGKLVVRIPTVSSWAWENYRVNWVQLDAPRHLYLHSKKSIVDLSSKHGLRLVDSYHDSDAFQFWGSELYSKNIALNEAKVSQYFSKDQIDEFLNKAHELNEQQKGDQVALIFAKAAEPH